VSEIELVICFKEYNLKAKVGEQASNEKAWGQKMNLPMTGADSWRCGP
jgi:hypothetical protein